MSKKVQRIKFPISTKLLLPYIGKKVQVIQKDRTVFYGLYIGNADKKIELIDLVQRKHFIPEEFIDEFILDIITE